MRVHRIILTKKVFLETFIFFISLIFALLLAYSIHVTHIEKQLFVLGWGVYLLAFLAGFLFVYSATGSIGLVLLLLLSRTLPLLSIALLASVGAVFADSLIFGASRKVLSLYDMKKTKKRMQHTGYTRAVWVILGVLFYVLPIPDEIGMTILGISTISLKQFLALTFLLNLMMISAFLYFLHI